MASGNGFSLLTGSANVKLAKDIGKILKVDVDNPISNFADGEIKVVIPHNLRGKDVFIIQPTSPPVNNNLMEVLLMVDAVKRASANSITVVIPYFGYSRQDRKERSRVPVSASLVAKLIESGGANRILTVDIHSEQQQGFFNGPWDNVYGSYSLVPVLENLKIKDLIIASPDKGGVLRAVAYAKRLNADGLAIVYKERDIEVTNKSEALDLIGAVKDKNVLIVDDMIDTAGTLINASDLLLKRGAKSVRAATSHGIFSDPALERIKDSQIEEIYTTDTIFQDEKVIKNPKIKVVTVAPLLAEAIRRIETGESISEGLII